ncbi:MAG: site-specific integrase [Spirochaetaceae bacterium]|nr:site-specific integrase [Spirochaetaceae bacterium]
MTDTSQASETNVRPRQGPSAPACEVRAHRAALKPTIGEPKRFEDVAEEVFRRYGRTWKPRTVAVNRSYLRNQIMPWFRERPIDEITRAEVQRWLASLHATPAAATRSLPILSVILRQAEVYGHRRENTNPCTGVRRYRQRARERLVTAEEARRLGVALAAHNGTSPVPASAIRLLLLTGCRQGEVRGVRWQDYREGHLFLRDSKSGPRTVWLSSPARAVLDRLPRMGPWMFPASTGTGPLSAGTLDRFWRALREEAGLQDLRLHDLRHSYASFALRQGETVLTIGRLLGHRDPASTLRYTHFADALVRDAVEAVGESLAS